MRPVSGGHPAPRGGHRLHLPYDQGGLLDKLYQQAKVESVEYGETIDVAAVCTPKVIGQLGPLVEGWRPHREPWED